MTNPIKIISKSEITKKINQEKVWDSIANPWKIYVVKKLPIIVEFLKNKKGKVIDLGCGTGRNMINNKNIQYYGVDFSKIQLKHAKRITKNEKINAIFFKSDISKLNKNIFKNNMFDYGLFISTLHCLETPKQRLNALKEFHRILKPNAQALISVWDSKDKRFEHILKNKQKDIYMSWKEDGIDYLRYYHLYDKQELINLLKQAGFKVLKIYKPRFHDRFSKKNLILKIQK